MADELNTNPKPPDDEGPEPDPAEAELVAYLDGELDPAAARRVEGKLAGDAKLRARAAALKRSFALLDFLPKPEPSPSFTTRTLDKLPAVKSSPENPAVAPAPPAVTPGPLPAVAAPSSSVPVVLASGSQAVSNVSAVEVRSGRGWAWAFGLLLAVGAATGAGYLGTAAARTYFFPPPSAKEPTADNLSLAELRVIENLSLYAAADDLAFVDKLAAPEFFGPEASAGADGPAPPQAAEPDKPAGKALDDLLRAFRELPADRQEKIRRLDHQLREQDPARRDRLTRVLEAYAGWLYRLPDPDRRKILAAADADDRLEAITDTRLAQRIAGLPAAQRQQLKNLPGPERAALITQWKADDDRRRDEWQTARFHWDALRSGRQPWPFTDEAMREKVLEFVQVAYHPDEPRRCRLGKPDRDQMHEAIERTKANEWVWLGKLVFDFSRGPRYEMLPEPADGKPVVELAELPPLVQQHYAKRDNPRKKLEAAAGRWPDFALAVVDDLNRPKLAAKELTLGPSRPAEFKPDVQAFLRVLQKSATAAEWQGLKHLEGKWPEYPRELVRLAKAHDLSVPGAMPPGPPSLWEKTYNNPTRPPVKPGG